MFFMEGDLDSWGLRLIEYCFAVPANRWGFLNGWNGFQLKIVQEVITVVVFSICDIIPERTFAM